MLKKVTRGNGILEGFLARQRSKMADTLIPQKLRTGSILDIGCGNYPHFLINTEFNKKHGLDRIPDFSEHYKEHSNIRLISFDLESESRLPYGDDSFDTVTMLAVLEHLEPDTSFSLLKEAGRVIKSGGIFVATTPCWWTDRLLKALAQIGLVSSEEIDEHKNLYSQASLSAIISEAGFSKDAIKTGCFELGMNLWVVARK